VYHATISLLLFVVVIAIFIWNRLPVGAVAIFTFLALFATGVLTVNEALAGFGDPVVLFIAALLLMVVVIAARIKVPATQLLMPMVFAGSIGSLLVLTASRSRTGLSASADAGAGGFFYAVNLPFKFTV
jgi:di/tricarboxylate transporter